MVVALVDLEICCSHAMHDGCIMETNLHRRFVGSNVSIGQQQAFSGLGRLLFQPTTVGGSYRTVAVGVD